MLSFWSKWLTEKSVSRTQKARRDRSHAPAAAQVEKFEERCLPSISTLVSLSPGSTTDRTLTVTATAADTIVLPTLVSVPVMKTPPGVRRGPLKTESSGCRG